MKKGPFISVIIAVAVVAVLIVGWAANWFAPTAGNQPGAPSANNTSPETSSTTVYTTVTGDGVITFSTPNDFGLAVTPQQVLKTAYIPPCDQGFNYCLYYNGTAYDGTNFESAGVSITKRTDLTTERLCLTTPPEGFSAATKPAASSSANLYSTSRFDNIGGAAAGHYAEGTLYRLFYRGANTTDKGANTCYQFEQRIGETQFANYPSGTIQKFTDADRAAVQAKLDAILRGFALPSGATIAWPS